MLIREWCIEFKLKVFAFNNFKEFYVYFMKVLEIDYIENVLLL